MKKIKKVLLAVVLGICTFSFASAVNAADLSLVNVSLVCNPNNLEPGQQTDCFIIGRPSGNNDGSGSLHGFVAQAFSTKDLRLEGAAVKDNLSGADSAFTKVSTTSGTEGTAELKISGEKIQFRCNVNTDTDGKTPADYGCAVYYSTTDNDAFTQASMKSNLSQAVQDVLPDTDSASYGTFGSLRVKLDESSTATNDCGEVCVKVWNIENKSQYENYQSCISGDKEECGNDNTALLEGGHTFCTELHMKSVPDEIIDVPDTGAFVSYIVLIAGALIAISAVAMAKKNNKFNKI